MTKQNQYIPQEHYARIRKQLDPRMAALCDLLKTTGYRVDDVLHTTVGDWRGQEHITLHEAKTGNMRTTELMPAAQSAVCRLLAYRPLARDDEPMFRGMRARQGDSPWLHRTTVWRRFESAVNTAGLGGNGYTIHSLRHCYARDQYERTQSLLAVQRDLGHKSLTTTMWYVCGADIRL